MLGSLNRLLKSKQKALKVFYKLLTKLEKHMKKLDDIELKAMEKTAYYNQAAKEARAQAKDTIKTMEKIREFTGE